MITKIKLNKEATFSEITELNELKEINFFYGNNGSGKTTISKLIASQDSFPNCSIDWKANNRLKSIVYNEEFVKEYFYQSDNLKGIFTLGPGARDIEERILEKKKEKDHLSNDIDGLEQRKKDKENEKQEKWNNFKEYCWTYIYHKYNVAFDSIFMGYRNSKEKLAKKIIEESIKSTTQIKNIAELNEKYNLLFKKSVSTISELLDFSQTDLEKLVQIEKSQVLTAMIIGKEDVDIAKMIHKLQNHDWVHQGKKYYDINHDNEIDSFICPFCQQNTSTEFRKNLEEYFDETYEAQIINLKRLFSEYDFFTNKVELFLTGIDNITDNKYFEEKRDVVKDKSNYVVQSILHSKTLFQRKKDNPSIQIKLLSISEVIAEINKIIKEINEKIRQHNSIVTNKEKEKSLLESEIWKFFYNDVDRILSAYKQDDQNLEKAIENIIKQIKSKEENAKALTSDISELEKQIKSVKPTVDAINKLLKSFGFRGFRLRASKDEKQYEIIRDDDSPAKETLSEGERNFIVFLYFYHLVQGVLDPDENITKNKIVVFDDPVSSLDSEVLFIVSSLIKNILLKLRDNEGNIKQIFLLTHNAYFYKEVTFINSRESKNRRVDTKYFIVSKINNISKVASYDINPVRTTYQLLWNELKNDSNDCINIQNAMRRIIEFYFNALASLKEDELLEKFLDRDEKTICHSLISWMNIGSHEVFDDVNYSYLEANTVKYKTVFKKIFEVQGHIVHYNMMMEK